MYKENQIVFLAYQKDEKLFHISDTNGSSANPEWHVIAKDLYAHIERFAEIELETECVFKLNPLEAIIYYFEWSRQEYEINLNHISSYPTENLVFLDCEPIRTSNGTHYLFNIDGENE